MISSSKKAFALKTVLIAGTLGLAAISTQALADCDEAQEPIVGKAIATAAAAKLAPVVAGMSKQMINLETCDAAGTSVTAEFKFNVIGADGLYWAAGTAKLKGGAIADLKLSSLSPNLAAASAKSGVKLASN